MSVRTRFLRMLLILIILVVGVSAIMAAAIYFYQGRVVFISTREMVIRPEDLGMSCEDVYIEVIPEQRINVWFIPADTGRARAGVAPTVLFCHGNAGNISHRVSSLQFFHGLGVNTVLFDYRGYGRSDGDPSEVNSYADAQAVYRWLVETKKIDPGQIYVFGRSLGGAVALDLAARVKCAGVVVESSFTSAPEMGQRMFPYLPIKLLARYRFDNLSKIRRINCPVLVTHSPDDQLIPYEMGRELYEAAGQPKEFIALSGDHNDREYYDSELYVNGLRRFFGLAAAVGPEEGSSEDPPDPQSN